MIIMWFKAGVNAIKIKVEEKNISIASNRTGLDKFFPLNTKTTSEWFNEQEKAEFDKLKGEKEVAEEVKRVVMRNGFRLILQK